MLEHDHGVGAQGQRRASHNRHALPWSDFPGEVLPGSNFPGPMEMGRQDAQVACADRIAVSSGPVEGRVIAIRLDIFR